VIRMRTATNRAQEERLRQELQFFHVRISV
jgi:hypothetical protein